MTLAVRSRATARWPGAIEQVEFVERSRVEQGVDALAGEHLALGLLALDRTLGAGVECLLTPLVQVGQTMFHVAVRHG